MTATEDAAAPVPGGLELLRLARRIGLFRARGIRADREWKALQRQAQEVYRAIRRRGTPQQKIILPDGTEVATISIERGGITWAPDEVELFRIALGNRPADVEDYVKPGALQDAAVVALIAEHFPQYAGRRVTQAAREQYRAEWEDNDGRVLNELTGEREQVATATRHEATGSFSVRWADKDKSPYLLLDAFDGGAFDITGAAESDMDRGESEPVPAAESPATSPAGEPAEENGPAGSKAGEPA